MAARLCRVHYRPAIAECPSCKQGLCDECHREALGEGSRCRQCALDRHAAEELERVQRESRIALRRAGIAAPRQPGEPVVLWQGPLRVFLSCAGVTVTTAAAALAAAETKLQWNVDPVIGAVALGLAVGLVVRFFFGGASRIAGITAALVFIVAMGSGQWLAGSSPAGSDVAWLSTASQWVLTHSPAAVACYLVASCLAYAAGRGRRPA